MEIIGGGFLAHNLAVLRTRHPDVVAFAAGVPTTIVTSDAEFRREAELLYPLVRRCVKERRRLVFFSTASAALYGGGGRREDGPIYPLSAYGRHNLALEAVLAASGVDFLVLRMTHLVGPCQRHHQMFPRLVAQVRSGRVEVHIGVKRDLLDVAHMVSMLDELLTRRIVRTVVNVASGVPVAIEDVVRRVEDRLGVVAERRYVEPTAGSVELPISIDRLRELVPAVAGMGFGPDYYLSVVDRYVHLYGTRSG